MDTTSETDKLPRAADRRTQPTGVWASIFPGGRRQKQRRTDEHNQPYYVDRYSPGTLALIVLLLALSIIDAVITLILIGEGSEEINPVMGHLLQRGLLTFLLGKYLLTATGIPLLLIFKNFYLFGTRFRVGYLIPAFIFLYVILISYQLCLMHW